MEFRPIPFSRSAVVAIVAGSLIATAAPAMASEVDALADTQDPTSIETVASVEDASEAPAAELPASDVETFESQDATATEVEAPVALADAELNETEPDQATDVEASNEQTQDTADDVLADGALSVDEESTDEDSTTTDEQQEQVAARMLSAKANVLRAPSLSSAKSTTTTTNTTIEAESQVAEPANGLYTASDGTTYYNKNGKHVTNQEQYINGGWYYFDASGAMVTGWKDLGTKTVYYGADGKMLHDEGETTVSTSTRSAGWYYFDHVTGAVTANTMQYFTDGGRWAYFTQSGLRAAGELLLNDSDGHNGWYYFDGNDSGRMVHGFWDLSDGRTVYYDAVTGIMHHGESNINDASGNGWRHFDEADGDMDRGFKYLANGNKTVYYDTSNGVMKHGEAHVEGTWYHFDEATGAMTTGWKHLDSSGGKWVYYQSNGAMLYGEGYLYSNNQGTGSKHWYWFNPITGATSYGFQDIPTSGSATKRVYYKPGDGWMLYGWQTISDKRYYLNTSTGAIKFGWQTIDGDTYYADTTDGNMLSCEQYIGTASDGHAAGWYHFNDTDYTLDTGWKYLSKYHTDSPKWVYYDPSTGGAMAHANFTQDGVTYQVDATTGAISNANAVRIRVAMQWMCDIANDSKYGYDQAYRWGERGDYDCSSLVISALRKAGFDTGSATYTGNMRSNLTSRGFTWITNLSLRQAGDILLNESHHTAMYLGNNWLVQASANENHGATGGKPGDQTGKEIYERDYYSYPWNGLLRFVG